jgi:hypothetical protein
VCDFVHRSDLGFPSEAGRENYCQMVSGSLMNDIAAAAASYPYICEFDIPGAGYNLSRLLSNEVFLRGEFLEVGLHARASFGTS